MQRFPVQGSGSMASAVNPGQGPNPMMNSVQGSNPMMSAGQGSVPMMNPNLGSNQVNQMQGAPMSLMQGVMNQGQGQINQMPGSMPGRMAQSNYPRLGYHMGTSTAMPGQMVSNMSNQMGSGSQMNPGHPMGGQMMGNQAIGGSQMGTIHMNNGQMSGGMMQYGGGAKMSMPIGNASPMMPLGQTDMSNMANTYPGLQRIAPGPQMNQMPDQRKRLPDSRPAQIVKTPKKKKKMADKVLPQKVREMVPESQAYMDLLAFERKLDSTITRKRLEIQEALKRPMKQRKKLRVFISNTFYPARTDAEDGEEHLPSWELRVEGRLLDDKANESNKVKRKFSSFFKSLVIELNKELYGPDNHLVEWHRTATTQETDGFQVKRTGDQNVKCTVLLMLDYQPPQFKLDQRLARLLGIHTQTRPVIINALWQYIKTHKLQDAHEREYINCDPYLRQIFEGDRMKFAEIPQRLHNLLSPPDPIVINHIIMVEGPDARKTACYDIDIEVDDTLKQQMNSFLLSTQSQNEIATLDSKIHETVETIVQLKTSRDFLLGFAKDPQVFINNWLISQTRDLKTMTDIVGNPEEERHADFYFEPWAQEAVCRYFYNKVQQKRIELEQVLGIRNNP